MRGDEFKELKLSKYRLHIEIAERTALDRPWIDSGIYSRARSSRYWCGNVQDIFVFRKADLCQWHQEKKPAEVMYGWNKETGETERDNPETATIRSFVLEKRDAIPLYQYRFMRENDVWRAVKRLSKPKIDSYLREAA